MNNKINQNKNKKHKWEKHEDKPVNIDDMKFKNSKVGGIGETKAGWEYRFEKVWEGYNPKEDNKGLDYKLKQFIKEELEKAEERGAEKFIDYMKEQGDNYTGFPSEEDWKEELKNFKKSNYEKNKRKNNRLSKL